MMKKVQIDPATQRRPTSRKQNRSAKIKEQLTQQVEVQVIPAKTDMEGYVKNLQILKAGDIFGIESVLKAAISQNTYAAYGELVKLVAIPVEEMKQIISLHPEVMQELLEIQFEQTSKFQRLWLLE